jgi:hypothetical protein
VYAIKGAAVRTVLVGGRVVVKDRKMLTLDTVEVMARVQGLERRVRESRERGRGR